MNKSLQKDLTQNSQVFEKTPKKMHGRKLIGFVMAITIPLSAAVISMNLMQKGVSVSDFIVGKLKGTFNGNSTSVSSAEVMGAMGEKAISSVFADKLEPIYADPVSLKIKSQNINLDLINVGVLADGTMETPKDWGVAGWFKSSGKPGEKKNLVINGHYDDNRGLPAAFFKIKYLDKGDAIEVSDKYGRIFVYKVVESSYVDIKDPSRLEVLNDQDGKSTLTLITCGGVWLPSTGYTKRLIVKAELEEELVNLGT